MPRNRSRFRGQVLSGVWLKKSQDPNEGVLATLAALEATAPADGVEGVLATRMVATHEAAMK